MKTSAVLVGAAGVVLIVAAVVLFQRRNAAFKSATVKADSLQSVVQTEQARQQQQAESAAADAAKPTDFHLVDATALDVPAQKYYDASFLTTRGPCRLQGHVQALAGGSNKDVRVFVQTDDDFANWKSRMHAGSPEPAIGLWVSPQQTAITFNISLPGPGRYHLVISNVFSFAATKTVQAQAHVICPP